MEILTLRAQTGGYRGCASEAGRYLFFQLSRGGRLKRMKSYPQSDFSDADHFLAIMLKNITPTAIFKPPIPVTGLTRSELDRVYATVISETDPPASPE